MEISEETREQWAHEVIEEAFDEKGGHPADVNLSPGELEAAALKFGLKQMRAGLEMETDSGKKADLRKAIARAERDLKTLVGQGVVSPDGWKPGLTHQELMGMDFPPMQWVVEGLLPVGATVLAGKPKLGKSFMALQIAQAVASGTAFLGMNTTKAPVLMIALEDSPRRIKGRLQMQQSISDLPIEYEWQWESLDGKGYEALEKRLEKGGPHGTYGLVIIDTLASAKSGNIDENKASDMGRLIYPLQRLAQEYQCALLLIFHHRKGAIDDPVWDVRGSGAVPGAVDVLVGLYKDRGSGDYCLLSESRDAPELQLKIEFDAAQTYSWHLVGNLNEIAKSEAEGDILTALESLEEADVGSIAKEVGKTYTPVRKTCNILKARGLLKTRTASTRSGSTKLLYRLSRMIESVERGKSVEGVEGVES